MPRRAPNVSKVAMACKAMKEFGIAETQTKPAVKHLLEVYANNWDFIEAENYKVVLDFIVPDENKPDDERVQPKVKGPLMRESKRAKSKNKQAPYDTTEVIEHPNKRYCTRQQKAQSVANTKHSESIFRGYSPRPQPVVKFEEESEDSEDSQPLVRKPRQRHINPQEVPVSGTNIDLVPGDFPELEISSNLVREGNFTNFNGCSAGEDVMKNLQVGLLNESTSMSVPDRSQIDVAPSSSVKNALVASSSQNFGFDLPNGEVSQQMMDGKCIKSYRTGECLSMTIETKVTGNKPESMTSNEHDQGGKSSGVGSCTELYADHKLIKPLRTPGHIPLGCFEGLRSLVGIEVRDMENICGDSAKRLRVSKGQNTSSKVGAGGNYHSSLRVAHSSASNIDDITKGEERFVVSLENGRHAELPAFIYIAQSLIYNKASVRFTLANISERDCCSECYGDCLKSSVPCHCVIANGGECAYTPGGLVKDKFLEECISMKREPKKHPQLYCKKCPLEKLVNGKRSVACKGHLIRRFIKECWYKCGCEKSCGNRIVQKGIAVKLQVFLTPEGKGWGLRTLEALPRGAFVCEYVGEVVTIGELHERNLASVCKEHAYRVLLDADWGSQDMVKDEKALCLDTTVFGNVARFINHRCSDATLVEIPVEVETPDRHYYHVALFTTRDVGVMEELTWDYGVAFSDHDEHGKPFRCLCGSPFCRDSNDSKHEIIYVRRRRKDGKDNKKDGVLDNLEKDLAEATQREEIQVEPETLMQLEVVPSMGALGEEVQVAPHASKQLEIGPCVLNMEIQNVPDQCMQLQVIPFTRIEPRKAMHCSERESVTDSSSSSTTLLAKKVADLRAQVEAEKAAREKDRINFEAHRAQFQAVMQQLSTLLPGFQLEKNVDDGSHMSLG